MKQMFLLILLTVCSISCSATNNTYKRTILDYLQTENGVKTDFKIEFKEFDMLPDITIADSINILQNQYQKEILKKVESAQQDVSRWEKAIEKQRKKGDNLVAKTLISGYQEDLKKAKTELDNAEKWQPEYLNRYDGRATTEVLAKKIDAQFSFQNPKLTVRQEISTYFILSPDGGKCYKMIKQND
jgi:hypothetical protein